VSAQPGIALGESGQRQSAVATTGRVLVKVDATNRPIHIGDLLVTSDVPGVAMKSEPVNLAGADSSPRHDYRQGLEPIEKGSAKILVLLSLQYTFREEQNEKPNISRQSENFCTWCVVNRGNNAMGEFSAFVRPMSGTTNIYYNGGNVGIGTSTPGVKLEVSGTPATSGNLFKFRR